MLTEVYRRLFDAFGPQHWWPGESPFEVMVGAVLTQNTNWQNVERAIDNLREADLLDPHALYAVPVEELEELIRPAGYFRVKARRLRSLLRVPRRRDTTARSRRCSPPACPTLRRRTARRPRHRARRPPTRSCSTPASCRASSSTPTPHRVFARHGWIDFDADYHQIQDYVQGELAAGRAAVQRVPRAAGAAGQGLLPQSTPNAISARCRTCCPAAVPGLEPIGCRTGWSPDQPPRARDAQTEHEQEPCRCSKPARRANRRAAQPLAARMRPAHAGRVRRPAALSGRRASCCGGC